MLLYWPCTAVPMDVWKRNTKLLLFAISQGTGPLRGPLSRPAEQKKRLSLTLPIQQHTGICQYIVTYHNAEQRRARKGGARGGKAGFVTPSAFPPRKLAHAKVSPRKGNPTAKVSPRKGNPTAKVSPRKGKSSTAKVSPLERKRPPPGASVRRPTLYNIWYNFLIIFINNTITCIL